MKKRYLAVALALLAVVLAGVFYLDADLSAWAAPYKPVAKDETTVLGGILALLKIFGVADSLVIFVMAAGALGYRRAACRVLLAFCVVGAAVLPLKHAVGRTRPDKSENVSFPSGDTATVSVLPTALALSAPVTAGTSLIAGGVAFSRIMFQRHFLSDVAAGMGIGLLAGLLGGVAFVWLRRRWRWIPPRGLFLLGMFAALGAGWVSYLSGGHYRHIAQLLWWYGPALALGFAAHYCWHRFRKKAPAERVGAISRLFPFFLTAAAVLGVALMGGVWLTDCATRLQLFSLGLAVLVAAYRARRFWRARRLEAGRAFLLAAGGVAAVYVALYCFAVIPAV